MLGEYDVRRDLVQRYMGNSQYTLRRISELLGYSMLSSFSRWFSAEFGVAPVIWRARRAHPAARSRKALRAVKVSPS